MNKKETRMNVPDNSEAFLWESLREGKKHALGELYEKFIDDLFVYGMQQSNHRDHVMDCIHDLFVDLFKYHAKLAKTNNIKFYLFKSLKRKINKKYKRKIIPLQHDDYRVYDKISKESTASYEDDLIEIERANEQGAKLALAMDTLTKNQRKVLALRFNQNRPYEEIAEIMNVSVATARTIIYRAIKSLKKYPLSIFVLFTLFL